MKRICIVGVGNELMGDDGIGPYVIRKLHEMGVPDRGEATDAVDLPGILRKEGLLDESVETSDEEVLIEAFDAGTSMLRAIYDMQGYDEAIVVDAIDFGGEVGEVVTFDPDEVESTGTGISMHEFDVIETIKMMIKLGELPVERVNVVAIQPEAVYPLDRLNHHIKKSVPKIILGIAKYAH